MKPIEWTAAEREAVREAAWRFPSDGTPEARRDAMLDALAPFVADRERQAAAQALYYASNFAKSRGSGTVSWHWLALRSMGYDARRRDLPVNPAKDWKEGKP